MSQPPSPPPPPPPSGGGSYPPPPPPDAYTGGAAAAGPRNDGMAVTALIIGIISIPCVGCGFILGPVGAILGFISRNRILASGGTLGGAGMAMGGIIAGAIGFVISIVAAIVYFAAIAATLQQSR